GDDPEILFEHSFAIVAPKDPIAPGQYRLPISFGIVPRRGDPVLKVAIDVDALDPSGHVVVSRLAVTHFIAAKSLLLEMFLAGACSAATCSPGLTCTERGCESAEIDP